MPRMTREAFDSFKQTIGQRKAGGLYKIVAPSNIGDINKYVLRLLPPKTNGLQPMQKYSEHYYQSPITGEWVNGLCPKQFNEACPLCAQNRTLWNRAKDEPDKIKSEKLKAIVKRYFDQEKTLVAVYVKSDPCNPANNGTIQVLSVGPKLHAKIMDGVNNTDIGEAAFDTTPQGLDFYLKAQAQKSDEGKSKKSGVNYELSEFARKTSPINAVNDNRTEEEIWKSVPENLDRWLPKKYTTEEWNKIVERTINTGEVKEAPAADIANPFSKPQVPVTAPVTQAPAPAPVAPVAAPVAPVTPVISDENHPEDDDLMKELNALKAETANSDEIPF